MVSEAVEFKTNFKTFTLCVYIINLLELKEHTSQNSLMTDWCIFGMTIYVGAFHPVE